MAKKKEYKTGDIRRTAKYIRVSTDQQEMNGDSLEVQEDKLNDYINSHDDLILADTYIDGGVSGQKLMREEITRLIEDVKADKIDLIIFTRLDRWFRNLKHFLNIGEILEKHNCAWIAIDQPYYETRTPYGRAFVNNSMIWAELEAQNDSDRIKEHNKNRIKNGFAVSGSVPLGFKIVESRMAHDDNMPIIVKAIELFNHTHNINSCLRYLADHGFVMTPSNFRQSIIRNEKYIGKFRDNLNYCPRAISDKTFIENNEILDHNMTVRSGKRRDYLFSSLIECVHCGHNYVAYSGGDKRSRYKSYRCNHAYIFKKDCDNRTSMAESKIEKYLLENIESEIRSYIAQYEILEKPIINNKTKIISLNKKLERLKDLYLNELITLDELKTDRAALLAQISQLEKEEIQPLKNLEHLKNFLKQDFKSIYSTLNTKEKRALWRSIIKKILIDRDRNLKIVFL